MAFNAKAEIMGVASVEMAYADQFSFAKTTAIINGCPEVRLVAVPRTGTGEERVNTFYDKIIQALTAPLTAKEKESGIYSPPAPPRVLFEGTYDDAQGFLQQTFLTDVCYNCPIAKYTDGLPVIIPTEEKVAEMLTGTSHKGSETLTQPWATTRSFGSMGPGSTPTRTEVVPAGANITFANSFTYTVEKVAICAVMAGCKPEYLPVALAMAAGGGSITNCPGTSSMVSTIWCVSGPIAKEIGMNAGKNALDVGNIANMTLGRVGALISINAGSCTTGLNRSDSGNPMHSTCFAEDVNALPPGWEGLNEESSHREKDGTATVKFTKNESIVMKVGGQSIMVGYGDAPASYRQLYAGEGALAWRAQDKLGIPRNTPGNYNPIVGIIPAIANTSNGAGAPAGFLVHPTVADLIYRAGFKTKADFYKWITDVKNFWRTYGQFKDTGFWQHSTDNGRYIYSVTGKPWSELPNDYRLAMFGSSIIIVSDGFADEHVYTGISRGGASAIDVWR